MAVLQNLTSDSNNVKWTTYNSGKWLKFTGPVTKENVGQVLVAKSKDTSMKLCVWSFFFFLIEYCKKVEVERSWRHSHEKEKKHISHFAEFFPHMHVQCAEMPTVSNPKEQYMQ